MVRTNPGPAERVTCWMELLEHLCYHKALSPCSFYMNAARDFKALDERKDLEWLCQGKIPRRAGDVLTNSSTGRRYWCIKVATR